jgi:hypothetical protein
MENLGQFQVKINTVAAPTEYGRSIHGAWARGGLTMATAIALLTAWHKARPAPEKNDGLAIPNLLGITDSMRWRDAETDLTTLRLMQLQPSTSL